MRRVASLNVAGLAQTSEQWNTKDIFRHRALRHSDSVFSPLHGSTLQSIVLTEHHHVDTSTRQQPGREGGWATALSQPWKEIKTFASRGFDMIGF